MIPTSDLKKIFHALRRKYLPPSKDEMQWQHDQTLELLKIANDEINLINTKFSRNFDELSLRLSQVHERIDQIHERIDQIHERIDQIHSRIDATNKSLLDFDKAVYLYDSLSAENQIRIIDFLKMLTPKQVVNYHKTRIGGLGDGGYVLLDDLDRLRHAFSFGIADNDQWDLEIAQRNIPVQQYDHSVQQAPSKHRFLSFYKKKVSDTSDQGCVAVEDLIKALPLSTECDVILKIDIEGDEWRVFNNLSNKSLSRVAQILCEFHGLARLNEFGFYDNAYAALNKIIQMFTPIHVHGNNCGRLVNIYNVAFPETLEVTFVNNSIYTFRESHEIFPGPLDAPNNPDAADIYLGNFKWASN